MKKTIILILFLSLLFLPSNISALKRTTSFSDSKLKTKNYITGFKDRNKYLLFNKEYNYIGSSLEDSTSFKTGGMLSEEEFNLSLYKGQSYISNGKPFWIVSLKNNSIQEKYIDVGVSDINSEADFGTRVTQYIIPSVQVTGTGTYSNPFAFKEGYVVHISSNNSSLGTIEPSDPVFVTAGSSLKISVKLKTEKIVYNLSDCGVRVNPLSKEYVFKNIDRDIICTANFSIRKAEIK